MTEYAEVARAESERGEVVLRRRSSERAADALARGNTPFGAALVAGALPRLVPPGTLRSARGLPSVVAVRGLFAGTFFAAETFVPLMLVEQRQLSPAVAGLSLTGGALGWSLGSYIQGRPASRAPRHVLLAVGGLLIAASVIGTVMFRLDQGRWPVPSRRWMLVLGGFLLYCASTALWSIRPAQSLRQTLELAYTLIPALLLATATATMRYRSLVARAAQSAL